MRPCPNPERLHVSVLSRNARTRCAVLVSQHHQLLAPPRPDQQSPGCFYPSDSTRGGDANISTGIRPPSPQSRISCHGHGLGMGLGLWFRDEGYFDTWTVPWTHFRVPGMSGDLRPTVSFNHPDSSWLPVEIQKQGYRQGGGICVLCPYSIACRGVYGLSDSVLSKKPLRNPLCGRRDLRSMRSVTFSTARSSSVLSPFRTCSPTAETGSV